MSHVRNILFLLAVFYRGQCSSSGPGPAPQLCGNNNFYCPVDQMCKPRNQRCTGSNICLENGVEDKCDCRASDGKCPVYLGTSPVFDSIFSSKRDLQARISSPTDASSCLKFLSDTPIEHQFIDFKGFTYEFGKSYLKQVLDRNEPLTPYGYKYRPGGPDEVTSYNHVGDSDCTYEEVMVFVNDFYNRYCACTHNCQDFAQGLQRWLVTDNCNRVRSRVGRRQTETEDLSKYFAQISFHDCNSGIALVSRIPLLGSLAVSVIFLIYKLD